MLIFNNQFLDFHQHFSVVRPISCAVWRSKQLLAETRPPAGHCAADLRGLGRVTRVNSPNEATPHPGVNSSVSARTWGVGTVVYKLLEDWSWVDAVYFSVVAVTTVGFGDLTPSTDASKLFTVAYVLTGISIITTYINARMGRRGSKRIQS
jgi:hypothetical protein